MEISDRLLSFQLQHRRVSLAFERFYVGVLDEPGHNGFRYVPPIVQLDRTEDAMAEDVCKWLLRLPDTSFAACILSNGDWFLCSLGAEDVGKIARLFGGEGRDRVARFTPPSHWSVEEKLGYYPKNRE